jgi:ABC-type glycerol-3-phosphate transport system permease component
MDSMFYKIHLFLSVLFFVIGLISNFRSVRGVLLKLDYKELDKSLAKAFLLLYYLQLVLGIILYFFPEIYVVLEETDLNDRIYYHHIKAWVISHVSIVLFSVILSQIGYAQVKFSSNPGTRFLNSLFYFGTSYLLTSISVAIGML